MPRNEVARLDPQQRLLLEVTRESNDDAGEVGWKGSNIGVYVGTFSQDWYGRGDAIVSLYIKSLDAVDSYDYHGWILTVCAGGCHLMDARGVMGLGGNNAGKNTGGAGLHRKGTHGSSTLCCIAVC